MRTVHELARVLGFPSAKLLELSGLVEPEDPTLVEVALRFAARSEPTAQLSPDEREAFEELARVLVDHSSARGQRVSEGLEDWIASDEAVRFGKPTVRGTRVTVEEVVRAVASGSTLAEVGEEFGIDPRAVQAALRHAARAASNEGRRTR